MAEGKVTTYALIATMLVGLILFIVLIVLYDVSLHPPTKYLLVIDCGLRASKFSLFEYTDWYGRSNAWIRQRGYSTISPGISSFADDPKSGAATIRQAANAAIAGGVPPGCRHDTRIFLGAVAGVRMLQETNPEKARALMEAVREELAGKESEGVVVNRMDDVGVVSGADQGVYAWLAVNYLTGKFGEEESEARHDAASMLGALNLGGASTQIAFVPQNNGNISKMVFGHTYNLYSHSHLCYGAATIRGVYLARLTKGADLQKPVASPCHQSGLSLEVTANEIFQSPCVTSSGEVAPERIVFRGEYNASKCGQAIEAIFADAPFANIYRPSLRGHFVAIHKLWEIVASFTTANKSVKVNSTEFTAAIDKFCGRSWTVVPPEEQVASTEKCLQGWIVKGLLEAYGFKNDSQWDTVTFLGDVGGMVTSWSSGFALDATARVPSTAPAIRMNAVGFIVGVAISLDVFLMSLFLLLTKCCSDE